MGVTKQTTQIYMGAYIRTGSTYKPFSGYPILFDVWNSEITEEADFLGGSVTQALSGYERGNPMGFRSVARIDLNNSRPASSSAILTLLNLFASQYKRIFYSNTLGTTTSTTVVLSGAVTTNNYYKGLLVFNSTLNQTRTITDYDGATRVATLSSPVSWSSGNSFQVIVPVSIPTIMGITVDATNNNYLYFNLESSVFGVQRQLTIGDQLISINLRGVERKQVMADNVRIAP